MQEKTSDPQRTSAQVGLTINKLKTKILRTDAGTDELMKIEGEELGEVESFNYLGSVMDKSSSSNPTIIFGEICVRESGEPNCSTNFGFTLPNS